MSGAVDFGLLPSTPLAANQSFGAQTEPCKVQIVCLVSCANFESSLKQCACSCGLTAVGYKPATNKILA